MREDPSVIFSDNFVLDNDQLLVEDLTLTLRNSIIWGSENEEFLLSNGGGAQVTTTILNNIFKSELERASNFNSVQFNFPGFLNPLVFDFSLDTLAFSINKGLDIGVTTDILGNPRDAQPDIGAFERQQ